MFARMPTNIDNYVWIMNLDGFGYSHCYMDAMKSIITLIQTTYVSTNFKVVCAYPNFVTKMVWNTLKPFLNERIKSKVHFINTITQEELESTGLFLQRYPREWGGAENAFCVTEGQSRAEHLELNEEDSKMFRARFEQLNNP